MSLQAEDALIIGCSIGGCLLLIAVIIIITVIVQSRCSKCCRGDEDAVFDDPRNSYASETYTKGLPQQNAYGGLWMNKPSMFPNGAHANKFGSDWRDDNVSLDSEDANPTRSADSSPNYSSRDHLVDIEQPKKNQKKKDNQKAILEPNDGKVIEGCFEFLEDYTDKKR